MNDTALPNLYASLKPGGFIGITTWAKLAWVPQFRKAVQAMPDAPYCPTEKEIEEMLYRGKGWYVFHPSYTLAPKTWKLPPLLTAY
jgi:hypothetical protein